MISRFELFVNMKSTKMFRHFRALFVIGIAQNVLHSATENAAKIVKSHSCYRLVVLKTVDEASADSVGVDKFVGSYSFFFHSFV